MRRSAFASNRVCLDDRAGRTGCPDRCGAFFEARRTVDSPQPPRVLSDFWTGACQAIDD